jgi:hypothetical protein
MKHRIRIGSILLLLLLVGAIVAVPYATRRQEASAQDMQVLISNETESLQVISSRIDASRLVLSLKNTGAQPIIAYHFDLKGKEGLSRDLAESGEMAPGSESTAYIPLNQLEQERGGAYRLNIAMAFFKSGEAEGSWEQAQAYREKLAGATLAALRIREIASRAASSKASAGTLTRNLEGLKPPRNLRQGEALGYSEAVIKARGRAEYLKRASSDEAGRGIVEMRKAAERQIALGQMVVEGRSQ